MEKSSFASGYNPKETPDMFVRKIMANRKRIDQTIKRYEAEQAAKLKEAPRSEINDNI